MASMDFGDAFDELADDDFWIDAAMVFGGFMAPNLAAGALESVGPDLPNELYGIGTAAAAETVLDERMVTLGAGLYTVDTLAIRTGIKQRVSTLTQGGN